MDSKRYLERSLNMPKESFVYAVHSKAFPNVIKIGKADNITTRLQNLNTSMPSFPYKLIVKFGSFDSKASEEQTHRHFAEYRLEKEFFKLSESQVTWYFTQMQKDHLKDKFDIRGKIRATVLKSKFFSVWLADCLERPAKRLAASVLVPNKLRAQPAFTADVWSHVAMHLRPRHLLKLMGVSKSVKRAVDLPTYWLREAVVVSWTIALDHCGWEHELPSELSDCRMVNLAHGYNTAMDGYIRDLRVLIKANCPEFPEDLPPAESIDKLSLTQLFEIARKFLELCLEDPLIAPKAFCQLHAKPSSNEAKTRLIRELDDAPIDKRVKTQLVQSVLDYLQTHPKCAKGFSPKMDRGYMDTPSVSEPFYLFT